jgi:DegV family protein with EDD domain
MKPVIVTDSTSNLPPEIVSSYSIPVIPLQIHWGDETYLDGVTLDSDTFYQWLKARRDFPMTSQPSAGEFINFFKSTAERFQTDTIIGVFISSQMSGTLASAAQAKAELPELHIELVDSRSVSMGLGFQVLAAVRAAEEGASPDEILDAIYRVRASMFVFFTVDTLEYLHRGGRIGGAARFLGTALNLKPLLMLENGRVDTLEKVRSRRKALQRLFEVAQERLSGRAPAEVAVIEVDAGEDAEWITAQVMEHLRPKQFYHVRITPVVGTHAGPGALGLVFYPEV